MKVWIVRGDDGEMEVLSAMPKWNWEAQGQEVYEAFVDGGDSNLIRMPVMTVQAEEVMRRIEDLTAEQKVEILRRLNR